VSQIALTSGYDEDRNQSHFSVRTENYRYIKYNDGEEELYDHREDPWETRNLFYGASVADARSVRRTLEPLLPPVNRIRPPAGTDDDAVCGS
jgi:hypothetical protein